MPQKPNVPDGWILKVKSVHTDNNSRKWVLLDTDMKAQLIRSCLLYSNAQQRPISYGREVK